MTLGNKWRHITDKDAEYDKDDTMGMDFYESPLKKVLIASAIAAGGILAYKSGMLKGGIKKTFEYSAKYKAYTPSAIEAFNSWGKKDVDVPINSIFKSKSFRKNYFKGKEFRKEIYKDTWTDLKDLKETVGASVKTAREESSSIGNRIFNGEGMKGTKLGFGLNTIEKLTDQITGEYAENGQKIAKDTMYKRLIKSMSLTEKQAEVQGKRHGYVSATIEDLFHVVEDKDASNGFRIFNKDNGVHIDDATTSRVKAFMIAPLKGEKNLYESGKYKNLIIDHNIVIEANGKRTLDMRNANGTLKSFVQALAKDYQIPIIKFNPLRMLGLDNIANTENEFAIFHKGTVQPAITKLAGRVHLNEVESLAKHPLIGIGEDVYKFNDDMSFMSVIASNKKFHLINGNEKFNREVHDYRKMANINTRDFIDYEEKGDTFKSKFNYYQNKIARKLDIGFQDKRVKTTSETIKGFSIFDITDPGTYEELFSSKISEKFKPYKSVGDNRTLEKLFGVVEENQDLYFATNKSFKIKDVWNDESSTKMGDVFKQLFAGRKGNVMSDHITKATTIPYFGLGRINDTIAGLGIGLSNESMGSTFDEAKNLILKRALPVYMGYQAFQYVNYLTEGKKDETGNSNNLEKTLAKGAVKLDMGWHNVKDKLGITGVAKSMAEIMPGIEQIGDIPGLSILDLTSTSEERDDYWKEGETAIRKGRYWSLGNTAFTGGKITSYVPNWYRRVQADTDFSDTRYGSRKEYFKNAAFPTPLAPFAPVRHFLTDKYHYEEKHNEDRPYLISAPTFENVPIVGPVLSSTLGKILKPVIKMHAEYWVDGKPVKGKEGISNTSSAIESTLPLSNYTKEVENNKISLEVANSIIARTDKQISFAPVDDDKDNKEKAFDELDLNLYETSSGNVSVVNTGNESINNINEELKTNSLKKILGTNSRVSVIPKRANINDSGYNAENPTSIVNTLQSQLGNTNNVLGMYGFMNSGFIAGKPGAGKQIIESSGYMNSFNKTFWDQELGGLGENVSEIFRRFVQKRRTDVEYFNPVKNDMASWLPGQDYFTDFQHGDPYLKVGRGEMRLPGQGYERLNNLGDPMKMDIGTTAIGKSNEDLEKYFLHQDVIIEDVDKKKAAADKKIRSHALSIWNKSGLAIETKGNVEDTKHGVYGVYDAIIHDATTSNGMAIASVESVSDEDYNKVNRSRNMRKEDREQINYLMWATNNDKGYVHYINRENPDGQTTIGMKFNKGLYKDTIKNLENTREGIKNKINSGEVRRGDLYSQMDRFKILSDIAPYSKEYQEQNAIISRMKVTPDEEKKISEIRDRNRDVKNPMRIYQYKFKTADIKYEDVTVTKIIDSNTFMTAERPDNPIRLAGIHVSEDKNNKLREEIDKTVSRHISEGKVLRIGIDANPENEIANDTLKTVHAVVYDGGTNLNQMFIKKGYAKEKENDWSPTGVRARFSPGKIAFGKVWETVAHFDSFTNTKFMQVRSAKENYERREVYGRDFQKWQNPIKDFIVPMIRTNIHRPIGIITAAFLGAAFGGANKNTKGTSRFIGAVAMASTVAIGKTVIGTKEIVTKKPWIPKEREKQRDLIEYMDTLKFVKNKRLCEEYANKALSEDKIDVRAMLLEEKASGKERKERIKVLTELKRQMQINQKIYSNKEQLKITVNPLKYNDVLDGPIDKTNKTRKILKNAILDIVDKKSYKAKFKALKRGTGKVYTYIKDKVINDDDEKFKARVRAINKEITDLQSFRMTYKTSDNATKAIFYKQKSEETMYGYDVGDPLANVLKAMPKKDREYMKYFMKTPKKEQKKVLKLVPNYMKRPLQSSWGMTPDDKEDAIQYFTKHQLPSKNWEGWKENKDIDSIKVKMVKHEAQDFSEFNIWQNDVDKANQMGEVPLPKVNFRSTADSVRYKMMDMLGNIGMRDVQISYNFTGNDASVNANVYEDKRDETEEKLKQMSVR